MIQYVVNIDDRFSKFKDVLDTCSKCSVESRNFDSLSVYLLFTCDELRVIELIFIN